MKVDPPAGGANVVADSVLKATFTVGTVNDVASPNANNAIVAWSYTDGNAATIAAIIVKAADAYTIWGPAYGDGPCVFGPGSGLALHAPVNASGKWPGISHFNACYTLGTPPTTAPPTTGATPTTPPPGTEAPTTTSADEVLPPEGETTTTTTTPGVQPPLPETGGSSGTALVAVAVLLTGLGLVLVSRRRAPLGG